MDRSRLAAEIEYEVGQLRKLAEHARQLSAIPEGERRPWDAAAAAKYIADISHALENMCRRCYAALGLPVPGGSDCHSQILGDFLTEPSLGQRLAPEVPARLKRYLAFRHRFIHGYAHEVTWGIVAEPLALIPETVDALAAVWLKWLKTL